MAKVKKQVAVIEGDDYGVLREKFEATTQEPVSDRQFFDTAQALLNAAAKNFKQNGKVA